MNGVRHENTFLGRSTRASSLHQTRIPMSWYYVKDGQSVVDALGDARVIKNKYSN